MDRRQFIASGTSAAALALAGRAVAQGAPAAGDAKLTQAFDQVFADLLRRAPEFATSLGLDTGANADLRGQLGDNSYASIAADLAKSKAARATIAAVDPAGLSAQARVDREVVLYNLDSTIRTT